MIHIIVQQDFLTRHINFASPYVSQEVALRYAQFQKAELRDFLSASDAVGQLGALRGNLFEGYSHNVIQRGGTFDRRNLDTNVVDKVTFPAYKLIRLASASDIANLQNNEYGLPIAKNFESIDAVSLPNNLFQMTVSHSHPTKSNGYKRVAQYMNTVPQQFFDLYFVVPPDVFTTFGKQPFHTKKKTVVKHPPNNVVQYALKLPLTV